MLGLQLLRPLPCQDRIAWGLPPHLPLGQQPDEWLASLKTVANDNVGSLFGSRFKDTIEN